ncbi:hypothetical protein [Labilibacter marinus]|uniref:hypothetical protein n=1 Tax=Labilibacter marinus TaxID=1477105 RepID=UPI0009500626|nr:hypothetical protein [Labilibacter marinus]
MAKLMHIIMLSCLKATELIEKKLDHKLNMMQNIQLAMHKSMCKACTNYEKHSYILDDVLKHPMNKELSPDEIEKLKKSIITKLNN